MLAFYTQVSISMFYSCCLLCLKNTQLPYGSKYKLETHSVYSASPKPQMLRLSVKFQLNLFLFPFLNLTLKMILKIYINYNFPTLGLAGSNLKILTAYIRIRNFTLWKHYQNHLMSLFSRAF